MISRRTAIALLLLGAAAPSGITAGPPAATGLPGDSLYHLALPLEDQRGAAIGLDRHRGHPTLVTMFYGSCPHVCPMLIARLGQFERQLQPDARAKLRFMLVSLDPARDSPPRLLELAQRHRVDLARWTFARAPEPAVRSLSAALGIRYRKLPDGEFNHSTVITLLDGDGRVLRKTSNLKAADPEFEAALRQATALRPPPAPR